MEALFLNAAPMPPYTSVIDVHVILHRRASLTTPNQKRRANSCGRTRTCCPPTPSPTRPPAFEHGSAVRDSPRTDGETSALAHEDVVGLTGALQLDPEPACPLIQFRLGLKTIPVIIDHQLQLQERAGALDDVDAHSHRS